MYFSLQRNGKLPLRFDGKLLAISDDKRLKGVRWRELAIYRMSSGQYVVHTIRRTTRQNERDRSAVVVRDSALDVLRLLACDGGRLTALDWRTLGSAAVKDDMLGGVIARELL